MKNEWIKSEYGWRLKCAFIQQRVWQILFSSLPPSAPAIDRQSPLNIHFFICYNSLICWMVSHKWHISLLARRVQQQQQYIEYRTLFMYSVNTLIDIFNNKQHKHESYVLNMHESQNGMGEWECNLWNSIV